MKNYTFFKLFILLTLTFISLNSFAGDDFRRPFQMGDYYEYVMQDYNGLNERYRATVINDTLIEGLYVSTLLIQGEPPMPDYTIVYKFDSTSLNLHSNNGIFCPDPNGNYLLGGFNAPVGYTFNTCNDTLGGIYFKSEITSSGINSGILQSGISLKFFTRSDTIGTPVDYLIENVYSEFFGFIYLYSSGGSPFGQGWYTKELKGAIIDGVTYGTILLSVNQLSSEIPDRFSLSQNYPNPFNPTTSIKFKVQSSKFVKLKVYDVMGREVAVLVNENLGAGEYEEQFDGSGLSSGMYFYKLEADGFSEVRKMMLVK